MTRYLITNVRIFDGSGAAAFPGSVLVTGNRITSVIPAGESFDAQGANVIDGMGCFLMPGMTEGHAHLSFGSTIDAITTNRAMSDEERLLRTTHAAKTYIDYGWTSAYSAGAHSAVAEVALRDAINEKRMTGPRLRACSFEKTSSLLAEFDNRYAGIGARPVDVEGTREFVREMVGLGVDSVKFVVTGESAIKVGTSQVLQFYPEEMAAAQEEAEAGGVWLNTHCHSAESVIMSLTYGFRVLYHCTWTDEEGMDMMEAQKDRIFVAPAPGVNYAACYEGEAYGITREKAIEQEQFLNLEKVSDLMPKLKKRGVRVLPGGDYGFPFNPIGKNARDLELFVTHFGFSEAEALRSACEYGGQVMAIDDLGLIRDGWLADLILVAGDPLTDIACLQQRDNIKLVMKDGDILKSILANPWTSAMAAQ